MTDHTSGKGAGAGSRVSFGARLEGQIFGASGAAVLLRKNGKRLGGAGEFQLFGVREVLV